MNFKHPLFITALIILVAEIIVLSLMPEANYSVMNEANDPMELNHVPYMLVALTLSFISAFALLVAGIIFILKRSSRKNIPSIIALLLAFIIPMITYQFLLN